MEFDFNSTFVSIAEEKVKETKQSIVERGNFLTTKELLNETLKALKNEYPGLQVNDLLILPLVKRTMLIEKEMDGMIRTFILTSKISTVHDLSLYLSEQAQVVHFDACGLGKLIRHSYVAQHFKITRNIANVEQISADDVYIAYSNYLKRDIADIMHDSKALSVWKSKTKYTPLRFFQYLENEFRKPLVSLGISIQDFSVFHGIFKKLLHDHTLDEMWKQLTLHVAKYNNYLQKLTKEQHQDYNNLIAKADTGRIMPWRDIVQEMTHQFGEQTHEGLFDQQCMQIAMKWNKTCAVKPMHIAALSMSMSHLERDTKTILHMSSLYVYLEAKDPETISKLNTFITPLSAEDRRIISQWVGKIKSSNWNFSDLRKYMSQAYMQELRQKNMNGPGFKINISLYLFVGRLILASYLPTISFDEDALNSLQTPVKMNIKNIKRIMQEVFNNIPTPHSLSLIDFQKMLSQRFGGSPFFFIDDNYLDFLEAVQQFLPEVDISLRTSGEEVKPSTQIPMSIQCVPENLKQIVQKMGTNKITSVKEFLVTLNTIEKNYFTQIPNEQLLSNALMSLDQSIINDLFQLQFSDQAATRKTEPSSFELQSIFSFLKSLVSSMNVLSDIKMMNDQNVCLIEAALKEYTRVSSILELGYGDIKSILRLYQIEIYEPVADIMNAIPLGASYVDHAIISHSLSEDNVINAICSSKYLFDLETLINWSLFKTNTSFYLYLKTNWAAISSRLSLSNVSLLESSYHRYMLIPSALSCSDYQNYLNNMDFYMAVSSLMSLTIQSGSVAHLPLSTIRIITTEFWNTISDEKLNHAYNNLIKYVSFLPNWIGTCYMKAIFMPTFHQVDKFAYQKLSIAFEKLGYYPCWVHTLNIHGQLGSCSDLAIGTKTANHSRSSSLTFEPIETNEDNIFEIKNWQSNDISVEMDVCELENVIDQKQVIQDIRRNKFGLDILLTPENKSIIEAQHERNCRALKRLSNELYSQDSHFVLELLQNADDNPYAQHEYPFISFTIKSDGVIIVNNEKGFSAKNIRALCDVGMSTKSASDEKFIGQKGIGFKSVFRVTDNPEIHSNGFHLKFSSKDFIVPEWIDCDNNYPTTTIVLPFNEGVLSKGPKHILRKFQDIQPVVLLFLRRLQQIKITDGISGFTSVIQKKILENDEILLSFNATLAKWHVYEKSFIINLLDKTTALSTLKMAIPLDFLDEKNNIFVDIERYTPIHQDTFAFLPLRSYGFKFVLHGDFSVPSSREDVDHDSVWNEQLRSAIPLLFIAFFEKLKAKWLSLRNSSFRAKHLSIFLTYVPLEMELFGFFKPVGTNILVKLKQTHCILTGKDEWDIPTNVASYPRSSQIIDDIPQELIERGLRLHMVHQDVYLSEKLKKSLGIQVLNASHMIELLRFISISSGRNDRIIEKVLKHFILLLDRESEALKKLLVSELKGISIFKLRGSFELVHLNLGHYFYLKKEEDFYDSQANFFTFFTRMNILDLSSYALIREDRSLLDKLLGYLDVEYFTGRDVIQKFMLPDLIKQGLAIEPVQLVEYTFFISNYIARFKNSAEAGQFLEQMAIHLPLLTSQGMATFGSSKFLHLPKYLHGYFSFGEIPFWNTLSNDYKNFFEKCQDGSFDQDSLLHLQEFFTLLGIQKHIYITQTKIPIASGSFGGDISMADDEYIQDFDSEELAFTFNVLQDLQNILSMDNYKQYVKYAQGIVKLCKALSVNWEDYYMPYTKSKVIKEKEGSRFILRNVQSSFLSLLKTSKWIPTMKGNVSLGSEIYMSIPEVREILQDEVEYCAIVNLNTNFATQLGIKREVEDEDLFGVMNLWATRGGEYEFSFQSIKSIYTKIYKKNFKLQSEAEFNIHVFVPVSAKFSSKGKEKGIFVKSTDCVWFDPDHMLPSWYINGGKLVSGKVVLSLVYSDQSEMRMIFESLGVPNEPLLIDYLKKLCSPTSIVPLTPEAARIQLQNLSLLIKKFDFEHIKNYFTSDLVFIPTHHMKMVTLNNNLYINDAEQIAKLFEKYPNLSFIGSREIETALSEDLVQFFQLLGVKKLSHAIKKTAVPLGEIASSITDSVLELVVNAYVKFMSGFGIIIDPRKEFRIILSDQLDVQLTLQNSCEFISSRYFVETLNNTFILHISRAGMKMFGEVFYDLSVSIHAPKSILEDIRNYFNQISQLCAFPEMIIAQLKHDGNYVTDGVLVDIIAYVEDDPSDNENAIDIESNLEKYEESRALHDGQSDLDDRNATLGSKRPILIADSPEHRLRERKQKRVVRESESIRAVNQSQSLELKDSYDAYLALNRESISILKSDILSFNTLQQRAQDVKATGLIGEEIVFLHLRKKYHDQPHIQVNWINEKIESGQPYDISIYDSTKKEIIEFIEVKATSHNWRDRFEVSTNEWQFARIEGEKFTILRVSGVNIIGPSDSIKVSVVRFNDPHMLSRQRYLKLQHQLVAFPQS